MARYPHLPKANRFPDLDTVNAFGQYENDFDYENWHDNVRITFCNVPWDEESNLAYFAGKTERDAWLKRNGGQAIELSALARIEPEGSLRAPMPFDTCQRYNYVYIDWPQPPVEYGQSQATRLLYFISNTKYINPSTTEVSLSVDWWQSYVYDVTFSDVTLSRGHYPMAQCSADDFLGDKTANLQWVTGAEAPLPDAPFRLINLVSYGFDGAAPGEEYDYTRYMLVLVSTCGYPWELGMPSNNTWELPAADDNIGILTTIAIPFDRAARFYRKLKEDAPEWLSTVVFASYVKSELCSRFISPMQAPSAWRDSGVLIDNPVGVNADVRFTLAITKANAEYPAEYADIAKLYTWPYLNLEIADESGINVQMVTLESLTNQAEYHILRNTTAMQPGVIGWVTGMYGDVSNARGSAALPNSSQNQALGYAGYATMRTWELPSYGIVQANRQRAEYQDYYGRIIAERTALNAQAIGHRTAETSKKVSDNTAKTGQQNAYNSADTAYTNTANIASTALQNSKNNAANITRNNAAAVTASTNITTNQTANNTQANEYNSRVVESSLRWDKALQQVTFAADLGANMLSQSQNAISAAASAGTAIVGGAVAGAGVGALGGPAAAAGGALVGAVTAGINSAATTGISYHNTALSLQLAMTSSATIHLKNQEYMTNKTDDSLGFNHLLTELNNSTLNYNNAQQSSASNTTAANNANLINTNATNDNNTTIRNAANAQTLAKTNADNSYNLAIDSNQRNYDMSIYNTNDSYRLAHDNIERGLQQAGMQPPVMFGTQSQGVLTGALAKALIINIRRIDGGALKTVGDMLLRWGYRWQGYIGNVPHEQLTLGRKLAYWQCETVKVTGCYQTARYMLERIMTNGATIWATPEAITEQGAIYNA